MDAWRGRILVIALLMGAITKILPLQASIEMFLPVILLPLLQSDPESTSIHYTCAYC